MGAMETTLPAGKKKRMLTAVFFTAVALLGFFCLALMNAKYDSLSRYPYTDRKSRQLIKKYLNKEEIEYIIEYSIAPNMFIAYIQEPGFNIYHATEYKKLSEYEWQEPPDMIVTMVEESRQEMDVETLADYLVHYSWDEIDDWLKNHDPYNAESVFVKTPGNMDTYLDSSHTIGIRVPFHLEKLPAEIPAEPGSDVSIDMAIDQPLKDLCQGISGSAAGASACGGLMVQTGYISYQDQKTLYANASAGEEPYPGHSEHQLGLTVDFAVDGIQDDSFAKTSQYLWLQENAWKYGFMETWNAADQTLTGMNAQPYHWRYVGEQLASQLHASGQSFAQWYAAQNK